MPDDEEAASAHIQQPNTAEAAPADDHNDVAVVTTESISNVVETAVDEKASDYDVQVPITAAQANSVADGRVVCMWSL